DDAVAMMLALAHPAIDLLGITTVGGNQTLDKITRNAQSVLVASGRDDVPVYAGSDRPLVGRVEIDPDIHGDSGLDGGALLEPTRRVDELIGVQYIVDTACEVEW